MSQVNLGNIIDLLKEFAWTRGSNLQIILVGGLAVQYYGMEERATIDFDAEIKGDVEEVIYYRARC